MSWEMCFYSPKSVESLNKHTSGRGNRFKYRDHRNSWHREMMRFLPNREREKRPVLAYFLALRGPYITKKGSVRPGVYLDKDNLYGAFKPVRDVIADLGYLWQDSPHWCEYECAQQRAPKSGTVILLRSLQIAKNAPDPRDLVSAFEDQRPALQSRVQFAIPA